jgi:ATP-binding cassette subfamily B protein
MVWVMLLLIQGVLPVGTVYATKLVVDGVVRAAGPGGSQEDVSRTLVLVVLTAGLFLGTELFQSAVEWIRTAQSELVQDYVKNMVHAQTTTIDLAFYESPEYHDGLEQAQAEAATRPLALLEGVGSLVQNAVTLAAMAAILVPFGAWLPVVLVLSSVPALSVVIRFDRRYHRWWQKTTSERRWTQYYDGLLTHSATAAEVRLFALGLHLRNRYQQVRRRLRTDRLGLLRDQTLAKLVAGAAGLIISGGLIGWMVWRAMQGMATLGDLVLFYQALQRGQGLMRTLLGNVGQIYGNTLYLKNLFAFLDMQPRLAVPSNPLPAPISLQRGIRFRDVVFYYPDSKQPALDGFNLNVPARKIVAIVGANGAGKTTLIKLLCRFYDPQQGSIELDGIDIRDLSPEDLRRRISVLFQLPTSFLASVHDSIALGDLAAGPSRGDTEAAARCAGVHELAQRLPHGYDTLLGKWFGEGVELSGGEWQRVAMARAYLRRAPLILLDEPTSFMDSWAEVDWFNDFRALAEGRTGIIITHRFTIAMRADVIHVMEGGRIVESGTHRELVERGGLYAQSWTAQMQADAPSAAYSPVADSVVA